VAVLLLKQKHRTATRRFQKQNGRYVTVSEMKRLQIYNGRNRHGYPFGCSIAAMFGWASHRCSAVRRGWLRSAYNIVFVLVLCKILQVIPEWSWATFA
jgi:hypothetical protein